MSAILYKKAYQEMVDKYSEQFLAFSQIHDRFKADQNTWKDKFDELGLPLVRIISDTENRLCSKMEKSHQGQYSAKLADKFRAEVKAHYPLIELVGVTIS
jgi:hypothetical protein